MYTIETFKTSNNKWTYYQLTQPNFNLLVDLFGSYLKYNTLNKYNIVDIKSIQIGISVDVDLDNYVNVYLWIADEFINEEIRFKNYGSELIYKIEQLEYANSIITEESNINLENESAKLYISSGQINLDFFNNYIKQNLTKNDLEIINKFITELDPEYEYFEYYSISTKGREEYLYNELLLLDINHDSNKLFPIYFENINTSSTYALERCYTDYDDYESEPELNYIKVTELNNMIIKNSYYNQIKNNIINNSKIL